MPEDLGPRPELSLRQKANRIIHGSWHIETGPINIRRGTAEELGKAMKRHSGRSVTTEGQRQAYNRIANFDREDYRLSMDQKNWDEKKSKLETKAKEKRMRGPLSEAEYHVQSPNRPAKRSMTPEEEFDSLLFDRIK